MSKISPLPEATTRLLGSSLVIITPVTLVKELLDNSIDAKATSIEVLVSTDTVKKIEVRDNGLGIHPDDYDALGRRSHTSKLRNLDDLKTQSSKTLGFRGEALASVNSFAKVTITTKIASEPVASILHILPNTGGVSKQLRTSAPVGTTVSITDLFGRLPVREQTAIKNSTKTIDMIRELLRSYAMARPQVRLSFKVLQSPKQSWSYSPKLGAGVKEAAIQLFGTELASQCDEKIFETGGPVSEDASTKHQDLLNDRYVFEAFIPKPGSDLSKISKHRYFSIDSRPIAAKRGTMKKLLGVYSERLSIAFRSSSSAAIPKDCFIRLNIKCPPGSYDVNIEPSKDDIIFSDEQAVLDGFRDLCKEAYVVSSVETPGFQSESEIHLPLVDEDGLGARGSLSPKPRAEPETLRSKNNSPSRQTQIQVISDSELLSQSQDQRASEVHRAQPGQLQETSQDTSNPGSSAFTPINAPILSPQNTLAFTGATNPEDVPSSIGPNQWRVDMSMDYNERSYDNPKKKRQPPIRTVLNHQEELNDVESSAPQGVNPWIIAKTNAPKGKRAARESSFQEISAAIAFEPPMTPDPPILRHTRAAPRDLDIPASQRHLQSQDNNNQTRPMLPGGPFRSPMPSPQGVMISSPVPSTLKPRSRRNYLPPWSPPSSVPRTVAHNERLDDCNIASDGMKQTTISFEGSGGGRRKRRIESDGENTQQECLGKKQQLEKEPARRSLRRRLSQQKGPCQQLPSHHDHVPLETPQDQPQTHPRASQDQIEGCSASRIKEPIQTTLTTDDPRAYLLRRQKSMATEEKRTGSRKIRRLKSSLMPLENIPKGDEVHFLAVVEVVNTEDLHIVVKQSVLHDKYMKTGADDNGLEMTIYEGHKIEARLKTMLCTRQGEANNLESEPKINLRSLLKAKGIAVHA
ncbi:hypothetical protein F4820DRAFT_325551 [Hypoxylon rubiginosum]|uniref:Uncharacterized protein n=1 Tax=Hypoxylon rubiginosum TaxID=110542 RepID=A0ACB9YZI2_9PEZI|nr:hypothetical protein F4820DRAFT_325551 [Hypoxylon rubiginosum]